MHAQRPRLSVLLPCYNAALFLPDCIASLTAQTMPDFEVIAVDDGSSDNTPALLADWARSDARVRVLQPGRVGLVPALQLAAHASKAEILARMDADDLAEPARFDGQLRLLDQRPELAACGTQVRYFPPGIVRAGARAYEVWLNARRSHEEITQDMFVECPIAHPTLCIRRAALVAVGGYQDRGWPEDYDLVLRLFAQGSVLANLPEVLVHWRERADRASRTDARYAPDAFRRCKVHYLKQTLLAGRAVVVWGAGPVGKAFARELRAQDVAVAAFIDIDPRKIGQVVYDVPVWPASRAHTLAGRFTVAAVGSSAARALIRTELLAAGLRELHDFCAVA